MRVNPALLRTADETFRVGFSTPNGSNHMTHLRAALTVASIAAAASPLAAPHAERRGGAYTNPFSGTRNVVLLPVASEGILGVDRDLRGPT